MPRIADTSALYAAFVTDDAHHKDARKAVADPAPILVPGEVAAELAMVFEVRFGLPAARQVIGDLLRLPHVSIVPTEHPDAVGRRFVTGKERLSYPDVVVLTNAVAHGYPAWTYDKRLKRAIRAAVPAT